MSSHPQTRATKNVLQTTEMAARVNKDKDTRLQGNFIVIAHKSMMQRKLFLHTLRGSLVRPEIKIKIKIKIY